ncbi:hypothetical protein O6R08_09415 [Cutibacterium equinum]|uniref:Lipoprotein n=1 Tax=Cutibacterium equinum TaxID=3016342 RepID=A0ABY7QYA2_9ACTN|nr:hypothetical protein [Cutibacterium equinum]WCC79695.1 hypothetical protein O6R08_09415 [Cutibacterium equinum]
MRTRGVPVRIAVAGAIVVALVGCSDQDASNHATTPVANGTTPAIVAPTKTPSSAKTPSVTAENASVTYESVLVTLTGTFRDPNHPWHLDDSKVGFTPSGSKCAYRSVTWTTDEGLEPLLKASHWEGNIAYSVQDRLDEVGFFEQQVDGTTVHATDESGATLIMTSKASTTSMHIETTVPKSGRPSCKDFPVDIPDP